MDNNSDQSEHYTCFYCNVAVQSEVVLDHECFRDKTEGNLNVDENNVVYFEKDAVAAVGVEQNYLSNETEDSTNAGNGWNNEAVNLLINKYEENKTLLEKKNVVKKHIWKRIANEMNEFSYSFTWDQVQNKWKSLLRTYKKIRDNNNATGRGRKNWPFFDEIDKLYSKNPAIEPEVVVHNGDLILAGQASTSTVCDKQLNPELPSCSSSSVEPPIKRKHVNSDVSALLQLALEQNQKQHEEDMEEKKRFNDLLERLVNAVEKPTGK